MKQLEELNSERKENLGCQGWDKGTGKGVFHGNRVSVWEDKEVQEMGGGDGSTTGMHSVPPNCTLKIG